MSELKPCPFCGSNNVSFNHCGLEKGVVFVMCNMCCTFGPTGVHDEDAAEKWNRRAESQCECASQR